MQKFCKGEANLGYFTKKGGGAAASSVRGSTGRQCLKISLVILRGGGAILTQGGGRRNTPLYSVCGRKKPKKKTTQPTIF